MKNFRIRAAEADDVPLILSYILKLAAFEKLRHTVRITPEKLREDLFEKNRAEALLVEAKEANTEASDAHSGSHSGTQTVGFALYYYAYSTFAGKPVLYLEDFYIDEPWRGRGSAQAVFRYLREKAREQDCDRLQWNVLDWNERAIRFYSAQGARPVSGWTQFSLSL